MGTMDGLPTEIQWHICRLLERDDLRGSLLALRLTTRGWGDVATAVFFRSLTVTICRGVDVEEAVAGLTESGPGHRFLKYARKLRIITLMDNTKETPRTLWRWQRENMRYRHRSTIDTFLESYLRGSRFISESIKAGHGLGVCSGSHWEPLVPLLARLGCHLEEFDFIAGNEFPPYLSQAIARYHPACRVNLWHRQAVSYSVLPEAERPRRIFRFRFDLETLQLPGLHTLALGVLRSGSKEKGWTELEEMLPFLFQAPHLKHLILADVVRPDTFALLKAKWAALTASVNPTPVSSLRSISLLQRGPTAEILLTLAKVVNLSSLETLELRHYCDPAVLTQIALVVPNLKRLFMCADGSSWLYPGPLCQDYNSDNEETIYAMQAFNRLEYLHAPGFRTVSGLFRVLEHHGPSLKGLSLKASRDVRSSVATYPRSDPGYKYPQFTGPDIHEMARICPNLQELRLQVRRHGGNRDECAIYQALGAFNKLHTLILDLYYDSRPRAATGPRSDIDSAHRRQIFINAAIDEQLARGIWDAIVLNQPSRCLRNLRIIPFGSWGMPDHERFVCTMLARSYLLTRYNLDNPGVPAVTELGRQELAILLDKQKRYNTLTDENDAVLRDLWPLGPGEDGWMSGSTSFPLRMDEL